MGMVPQGTIPYGTIKKQKRKYFYIHTYIHTYIETENTKSKRRICLFVLVDHNNMPAACLPLNSTNETK